MRPELPKEVRLEVSDPQTVMRLLHLEKRAIRQGARGVTVLCPVHDEHSPSCSIHVGGDGTIAFRCHGCGASGDVFGLVGAVYKLSPKHDFVALVKLTAELGNLWHLVDEIEGRRDQERRPPPPPKPRAELPPAREYPPLDEVRSLLWGFAWADPDVSAYLRGRSIDPEAIEVASIGITYDSLGTPGAVAYALDPKAKLPRWASFKGDSDTRRSWLETGHRLLLPVVDASGWLRSVRACRITEGDTPKRLPPAGHRASELLLANDFALALLRGTWRPTEDVRVAVRVVEGEPDFLTAITARSPIPTAVLGIVSGSWSDTASRAIPPHALVFVQTHDDEAGDRYAKEITASLTAAGVTSITRERS